MIIDTTIKWELAQCLLGHIKVSDEPLRAIFARVMHYLEAETKTSFEASMKDRVWNRFSKEKLEVLKQAFIFAFCEEILGSFTDIEVRVMLEQHQKTGAIRNTVYASLLQKKFILKSSSLMDFVIESANAMKQDWIPQIVQAVLKEGIAIPELTTG